MKTAGELLLNAGEIRLLDGLRLMPKRISGGRIRGERLTRKKGVSIEFADFRDYVDGDDVRHLDWNVLARMQSPVIRTYQDEEDIAIYVMVDCSSSMNFGEPSKFVAAKKLAAAISYLALCGGDALHAIAACEPPSPSRAQRGRSQFLSIDAWLDGLLPDGELPLVQSLKTFAAGKSRSGLAVVISDGLDPQAAGGVAQLAGRGHEVAFVQILSQEELDPDMEGDLRLIDSESRSLVELTATGQAIKEYRENLDAHCALLAATCRKYGGRCIRLSSRIGIDDFVKNHLRREGWAA